MSDITDMEVPQEALSDREQDDTEWVPTSDKEKNWSEKRPQKDVMVRLEVRYALNRIAKTIKDGQVLEWDQVRLRSYNGQLVGPTIEARPGDTLYIHLDNQLPEDNQPQPSDPNTPHGFDVTNLHFHGMHVSPAGNADNVLIAAGPGDKLEYEVKIPYDHPAGTYWYHPHKHGSVTIQIASGMAGALIIRGDIDRVPAIQKAKERIFVFQQIAYALNAEGIGVVESYIPNFTPAGWATLGRRFTINGEVEPTLTMKPGEVQRWRFIHAGTREPLRLKLVKRNPQSGAEVPIPLYEIALDGITTGYLDKVEMTEMHPGYRVDVLVRAVDENGKPLPEGVYWLVDDSEAVRGRPNRDLARIVVQGGKCDMKLPEEKELRGLAPFEPIEDSEITDPNTHQAAHFAIIPSDPNPLRPVRPLFLVNGKPFDPHARPRRLKVGTVEEWIVSASDAHNPHPFHLHTNPFMFRREEDGRPVWKDTINLNPGQSMRLLIRYRRYIGTFMLHCHILPHEDLGMMESIEIVPPRMAHDHVDDPHH